MAKIFIDANIFIDLVEKRSQLNLDDIERFLIIDFNSDILNKAIIDPTSDLEDNIQLHSAAEADCDLFLTSDAKLLKLKFFGKTEITSQV